MARAVKKAYCAVCNAPVSSAHAPFCSARCRDEDLYQWLSGTYVVAGDETTLQENDDDN